MEETRLVDNIHTSEATRRELRLYLQLFSIGLAAGALVNGEAASWYKKSVEALAESDNDRGPSPKPPKGPNAGIGRIALAGGL